MEVDYEKQIQKNVNEFFLEMEKRLTPGEMARIKEAYELAHEAHKDQRRKSGHPYIIHPIAVARIVGVELQLGVDPICAAFLHDVVEDTPYTIDDIKARFGKDVAFLVDVVTKKKVTNLEASKQVENYKQILASLDYDIRALLIKLADRLHNMRTLSSMRPEKQMKIAGETDYFYAPLANRLGFYYIKSELENLSFRFRCPHEYAKLEGQIVVLKKENEPVLKNLVENIDEMLHSHGIQTTTEVRYRTPSSIWRKMQAASSDLKHVGGKHYIRIIYPKEFGMTEKDTSLQIYSLLTDKFKEKPGSVANYIDAPKENGYQSFHVKILSREGVWEEIHITSERMIHHSRFGCVAERTEQNLNSWLDKFRSLLKDVASHSKDMEFMDGVTSSFYNDDIMVFSPKGKAVILPKGATALDFAFEIHSDVGMHAYFARINGKLLSVKTVLRRGDCVDIGTSESACPAPDWLEHVFTYKAKKYLRSYFRERVTLEFERCPKCHPIPGDEVIGFKKPNGKIVLHKRNCKIAISLASKQGDSIVSVPFEENQNLSYPVRIMVSAIDRYHLLLDLLDVITNKLKINMHGLSTKTEDNIVTSIIDFDVHSMRELQEIMSTIEQVDQVDEVKHVYLE